MLLKRNVKSSIRDWVVNLLENPSIDDINNGFNPYHVYGETQMRDETFDPVYPFIYVTDMAIPYDIKHIPSVVIDADTMAGTTLEMGSIRRMHIWDVALHIWGNSRGERDDLSSYIEQNLNTITINKYSTNPLIQPSPIEIVAIGPDVGIGDARVGEDEMDEGTLANWSVVQFSFETIN